MNTIKRMTAFLLLICMALGLAAGGAEQAADECAGEWFLVYADVTIGDIGMDPDGSYVMNLYSENTEIAGTWSRENEIVTLTPQDGGVTKYIYKDNNLIPEDFDVEFVIRRNPGRITDIQLNEYAETLALPEDVTEEEMTAIIQGIYDTANEEPQREEPFGEFAGVWENETGGYLTIWGNDITAAFPIRGEVQTGFYGDPGEWTRDGNTLINGDGTIIVLKNDGSLLCSETSGTYSYTKILGRSAVTLVPDAERFRGDWKGIGILITDTSGVKVFAGVTGYDLKITDDTVYTVFEDETSAYPYEVSPDSGILAFAPGEDETAECVIYQDGTIRWELTESVTIIFRRVSAQEAVALYDIIGPVFVPAGTTATYSVNERIGTRTFTWSTEGPGVTIDPETGVLSVGEDTPEDTAFTVIATPDDGDVSVRFAGSVCGGVLTDPTFEAVAPSWARGFSIPALTSLGMSEKKEDQAGGTVSWHYETEQMILDETCAVIRLDSFPDAEEYYRIIRSNLQKEGTFPDYEERTVEADGVPVWTVSFATGAEGPSGTAGFIYAVRENTLLVMTFVCEDREEGTPLRMNMIDLETIAGQIAFNPNKAPVRREDGELRISSRNIPETVKAGKTLDFDAAFAEPDRVREDKANALEWTVADAETGAETEGITIDGKGVLTVDKDLTEEKNLRVTVASPVFGTSASYEITAMPVLRKLGFETKDISLFADSDDSGTVRVVPEPAFLPEDLKWEIKPASIAEVVPGEDGTAVLTPLAAGRGTLTVTEPGGKSASLRVNVMLPVTSMELSLTGDAVRGGSMRASANIKPTNAGDRSVVWSLDVGEDIATINEYGRIRIKGNVPDGTVITVICTSNGAKDPLVETIQIVVGGK